MSSAASLLVFIAAAVCEIAGGFTFWAWQRQGKPVWLLFPGILSLSAFAWLLTRVETAFAGRAYAAYGGIYVAASLGWLWLVEQKTPDRFDLFGSGLCLAGTLVILHARR